MNLSIKTFLISLTIALLITIASGCASQTPEPTPIPPTATDVQLTDIPVPTDTPIPPTPTATATATLTASPTSTSSPSPTNTMTHTPTNTPTSPPSSGGTGGGSVEDPIRIYFVQPPVGGAEDCGAVAIGVGIGKSRSNDISKDAEIALAELFNHKSEYVFGLYNPLFRSNIKVSDVDFNRSSGLITVNLRGTYKKPQDDCDNLRVKAQVWSTAKQFRGVKVTNIYLNGIPFGDRVSNDK